VSPAKLKVALYVPAIVAKTLHVYVERFETWVGPVTLVQVVIPEGTVARVQVPAEVGALAFVGPVTVAVNTIVLASVAVELPAVTEIVGSTLLTCVVCVALAGVRE